MEEDKTKKAIKFTLVAIGSGVAVFAALALVIWAASSVPIDRTPPRQQINHNNYAEPRIHHE